MSDKRADLLSHAAAPRPVRAAPPNLPGLPGARRLPSALPTPEALRFIEKHPDKAAQALHPNAPAHVRAFVERQSQRQIANEKFRDEIASTGTALPVRRALADIPLDEDTDRARELGKAHRQIMISDLSAVIRLIHRSPDIDDAYAMTLGRLLTGLSRVDDGWRFYVFEPSETDAKTRLPVGDVAAVKRAGMAAAVDAYMAAGRSKRAACEMVAKRMEICEATDFDFPAGEQITWEQIERTREEISLGRLKSYKQPIMWRGEETTPHKLYHKNKGLAQERGKDGEAMAAEFADMLLRSVIERRGEKLAEKP